MVAAVLLLLPLATHTHHYFFFLSLIPHGTQNGGQRYATFRSRGEGRMKSHTEATFSQPLRLRFPSSMSQFNRGWDPKGKHSGPVARG